MKRVALAAGLILVATACHDDKPPAGMPVVTLHPPVLRVPDAEFDYDFKVKYSWPTTNNKKFHLMNELTCVLNYTMAGDPTLHRARMHAFEFWALDENGEMKERAFDRMWRGTKPFNEAMECCDFTLSGVQLDSGDAPMSATLYQAGSGTYKESEEVRIDRSVNPPRTSSLPPGQRYYDSIDLSPEDHSSPPLVQRMRTLIGKQVAWRTRYGFRRPLQGQRKDVLVMAGVANAQSPYGDPAIPHDDCVWP